MIYLLRKLRQDIKLLRIKDIISREWIIGERKNRYGSHIYPGHWK